MRRTAVIVDDHAPFRALARAMLEAGGFEVVGEAADGRSAVETANALSPSLLLVDVQLPDIDGFEVARRVAERGSAPAVVLISARDAGSYRRRLRSTTACGFLPKSELSAERVTALIG